MKPKPKLGEIRLTSNGTQRKIYTIKGWQYICMGDPTCRIRAQFTCRNHRNSSTNTSLEESKGPKIGDTQTMSNGNRRIWKGERWQYLCRAENCSVHARDLCKKHQYQHLSFQNISMNNKPSMIRERARSCTYDDPKENTEQQNVEPNTKSKDESSVQLTNNKRRRHDDSTTVKKMDLPSSTFDLQTRNGRRVRCNEFIWKHLCAEKKDPPVKRKYQRRTMPITKTDQNTSLSSDTLNSSMETNRIAQIKENKTSNTASDINNEEHIVPKRKTYVGRKKRSNKSITSHHDINLSCSSVSEMSSKSMAETIFSDSHATLSLELDSSNQSVEIPVRSASPFCFDSASAILEQFGTIIKKEEEESLICVSPTYIKRIESPCETLQDFLRLEEMKKEEFLLDCQRISYRLAKIQDCIGSLSE